TRFSRDWSSDVCSSDLDPNFIHTVVYIYAHEPEEGAAGVILNRPTDEPTVAHLPEWRSVLAAPPTVFWGGPVAQDSGVVLIDAEIGRASCGERGYAVVV